jgi:hypothetical protein
MNVICLQDDAFYALIEEVVTRMTAKNAVKPEKWISATEAMDKLKITSKSTLQRYRDEGRIRYSQPDKKIIVYDVDSIYEFLEKHSKDTFQ